jgi:hypothetical protein
MTEEALLRAKKNREERAEKLKQYNEINNMFSKVSDDDIIYLDKNGNTGKSIYPTPKEFRDLLETIRNRLDDEIFALDEEFSGL